MSLAGGQRFAKGAPRRAAVVLCVACLGACSQRDGQRHGDARGPALPAAKDIALTVASPAPAPAASLAPSYEVAIASAQADRVHALNACEGRPGAAHAACVRQADGAYDAARSTAERIRGSGR